MTVSGLDPLLIPQDTVASRLDGSVPASCAFWQQALPGPPRSANLLITNPLAAAPPTRHGARAPPAGPEHGQAWHPNRQQPNSPGYEPWDVAQGTAPPRDAGSPFTPLGRRR